MNTQSVIDVLRLPALMLVLSLFIAACGGSSSGGDQPAPTPTTGTVALLFTDKPTDEFSAIKLDVVEAILIGGEGHQTLFNDVKSIDLLDLTNFNEPVVFGDVKVGTYTKLRLVIDNLELVPKNGGASIFPALPANGKIDLLEPDGFAVLPGRTLLVEVDMDANKSIKITGAGKSGKYNFRPVVKVNFMDGGLPDKLARIEGVVDSLPADPAGSLRVCDVDIADNCVNVSTDGGTSFFDNMGLGTDFGSVLVNEHVVVIGRYVVDGQDISLGALVVEIGGNAEQVKGNVVSEPLDNQFLMLLDDDTDAVVELQPGTKYFDIDGELTADAIMLGTDLEVEGVRPTKTDPADPDLIRAALIFVEAEDDEQLSGKIIEPLDTSTRSFGLTAEGGGDTCVRVNTDADILLVDEAASEVTTGTIEDLALDQNVDLFGITATDSCFDANEVIVEIVAAAS